MLFTIAVTLAATLAVSQLAYAVPLNNAKTFNAKSLTDVLDAVESNKQFDPTITDISSLVSLSPKSGISHPT